MWIETCATVSASATSRTVSSALRGGCGLKPEEIKQAVREGASFIRPSGWMWIETCIIVVLCVGLTRFIRPSGWMWIETSMSLVVPLSQSRGFIRPSGWMWIETTCTMLSANADA